jgi:biopolymer transport protein ExbD
MAMTANGSKGSINVTPMIDVLLVLLIIFMVVVNPDSQGLDTAVPQEPNEQSQPSAKPQDIILRVRGDGKVSVNQEVVAMAKLEPRLRQIVATRGNHVIFVGADRDLDFQPVVSVIDIARGVGLDRIALLPRGSF